MISDTLKGISYLKRGFSLISQPGIRRYVTIPLLINILVFGGFILWVKHLFQHLTLWLEALLPSWLMWLDWLLWLVFTIAILFFFIYAFTFVANIVAAPFNGFLSEKIEKILQNDESPHQFQEASPHSQETSRHSREGGNPAFLTLCKLPLDAIIRQLQLLWYFIPRAVLFLILFFIPGINVAASLIWFCFSGWLMALQYLDYPFDNHHISFRRMRKRLSKRRAMTLSFGSVVLVLSFIPLVNLVIIPAAVAGATVMWVEELKK
ncbi:MAG: sulfate transporter CysZ [Gammaproteobacteria bacterium]